ncbi:uncharacterized protein LOC106760653 [Vigna radiata var. radiata]|uniref:Uncharacterized protein LOC106760653 n=1 Tax=Vigna radiata var. radiata TaxID=3916 RepID=A0A1S3U0L2_VIGRR|nr:uncharacterized protein LOC106760653 [Vigna radiata var. radiata]
MDLLVVHKVREPDFVENENENEILYLCQGPAESGEGSGFEAAAEENEEVEKQCMVDEVGDKLDTHDEVEVEVEAVEEVEVEEVEVEEVGAVVAEEVGAMVAEEVEEVEVESLDEIQNSSEEEVEVDEVQNNSEEEVEVDEVGSEEDDNADKPSRCPFPTFGKKKSMVDYKWEVGTIFNDKEDFKEAIRNYAIHTGRDLKFVKNDKHRVRVRCMGAQKKCPWVAYLGYLPSRNIWQLRKILDTHACSRQLNIKMMNSKWLSHEVDKVLHDNPTIKVQDIRNKALRKWNTKVSISKARRVKLMATNEREGDFKEQFRRIHDYGQEVLRSNPGSTVKIKVNSDNGDAIFERIYVCLNACKKSFVSCRPIIFLDGCFLKGLYKGELLTTVGRDPNDQMLPIAYAVVEVENKDSWSWFLQLLIEDLGGDEICRACTWMSDQQKGLVHAIEELLPKAEQRFCFRHLYANFRKQFSGQILKNLMWSAATSTYPQAWEREMLNMRVVNEEAYKYLIAIPPRMKVASMDFNVCPKIKKRLTKECQLSRYWIPSWSARRIFEVRHVSAVGNKFTVDLDTHECSCRKWMISGIPCCHAVAAMHYINLDPDTFIPTWFMKSTYEETYASIIYPVNGHLLWENTSLPDVMPPVKRKMPGRPKKKRRLEPLELTKDGTQMSVGGHRKKCSICRQLGHNKKVCPLRPPIIEPT